MLKTKLLFKNYWLLLVFLAFKMILQLIVVNPVYELHRDEFLYLDQAKHLSAGYISVPPLTSWISSIIFFLGGSMFWIRFFPALFGALTMLITWLMIEELGGKIYSKIVISCAMLFSVLVRLNILYQPNAFDILAWTSVFYFLVRYIRSEKPVWIFWLMLAFILGMYNKYNIIFLLIGLLGGILLTDKRKILISKYFYISLLLGFLLLLPNVIWQINNRFPVYHHMMALKRTQLDYTNPISFLKDQLMFFSGSLALIAASFIAFIFYKPFKPFKVVGISFILIMGIFVLLKAKSYYAVGLYPVLLVFGGVYLDMVLPKVWKKYVMSFLILANLIVFISIYQLILPVLTPSEIKAKKERFEKLGLLRWNDGKNHELPQDFADMQGWKEMASKALLAYRMIRNDERAQTLVFCDNYGQTGAVNYYNRNEMPEAYSANSDYIFWLPRMKEIKNILLIGNKPSGKVIAMFADFKLVGTVNCENAIEKNTDIYLLIGANKDFTFEFYKTMDKRKAEFDIF